MRDSKFKKLKKNKAFTLIELLATITIVAVIALILLPLVNGLLKSSRKKGFVSSIHNSMSSINDDLGTDDKKFPPNGVDAKTELTTEKNPFVEGKFKSDVDNSVIAVRVSDGTYCANGPKDNFEIVEGPCYLLDHTAPVTNLHVGIVTSKSIQVIVDATDLESQIVSYEYSKDDGKTFITSKVNTVTFNNLKKDTSFNIVVKVTNENNLVTTKKIVIRTINFTAPYFTSNPGLTTWSQNKVVTIHYPIRQSNFIYQYSLNNGSTWINVDSGITKDINFTNNNNLVARVTDGYNTELSTVLTLTTIDNASPNIPSSVVRYDSASGSVRGNSSAWSKRNLWWGSFRALDNGGSGINRYQYSTDCTGSASGTLSDSHTYYNGTNYTFCIRSVDNAGNVSGWSGAYYFRVDTQAPSCSVSGGGGWTKEDLSIYGSCSSDGGGSGCSSATTSRTFTSNTSDSYSPGTIYDNAGNGTSCPKVGVHIDKTPPSCSVSEGVGWTNKDVTISGTCSDSGGSGCRDNVSSKFIEETDDDFSPGTIYDNAGNGTSCPKVGVHIDKTPPTAPKITELKLSGKALVKNTLEKECKDVGGKSNDAVCKGSITSGFGAFNLEVYTSKFDAGSGVAGHEMLWKHDGPGKNCPNWFTGDCGNWIVGFAKEFKKIEYGQRSIDKAGNIGYSTIVEIDMEWK